MTREERIALIKEMIDAGIYDWEAAVEIAADRILDYPESLLWQ